MSAVSTTTARRSLVMGVLRKRLDLRGRDNGIDERALLVELIGSVDDVTPGDRLDGRRDEERPLHLVVALRAVEVPGVHGRATTPRDHPARLGLALDAQARHTLRDRVREELVRLRTERL